MFVGQQNPKSVADTQAQERKKMKNDHDKKLEQDIPSSTTPK